MKKFITKTNWEKALKQKRNRKTFATNCLKKKGTHPNQFLLLKINYSGKLNHSFEIGEITDDVLQDNDLIAKELNEFFKNAVSR